MRAEVNAVVLVDLETAADYRLPLSVVRGITPMSGRWTWKDGVLAAAFRIHRNGICDGCGGYLDETTDASRVGPKGTHVHEHDKPVKCWTCAARADKAEEWGKNEKYPRLLRWVTRIVARSGDAATGS